MNVARARGLIDVLLVYPDPGVQRVAQEIFDALAWTDEDEYTATQRVLGAMAGRYGYDLSEASEEQAGNLAFVVLAGIGK
jgi:hypothetical protein